VPATSGQRLDHNCEGPIAGARVQYPPHWVACGEYGESADKSVKPEGDNPVEPRILGTNLLYPLDDLPPELVLTSH
jgi:hypothetical protein